MEIESTLFSPFQSVKFIKFSSRKKKNMRFRCDDAVSSFH